MAEMTGLIITEEDGSLSFGNYTLAEKTKQSGYEHMGDLYKVKTFKEITRLERNDLFVYESVPGTQVVSFKEDESGVSFKVSGEGNTQITLELEEDVEYSVEIDGQISGNEKTKVGGKFVFSADLSAEAHSIKIARV